MNHSPTGFEWGYSGSGPAQLALALLLDFGVNPLDEKHFYQVFKHDVISAFSHDRWVLTRDQIKAWVRYRTLPEISQ